MKRVTVVTVAYNAEAHIEKTIQSIIEQNFDSFEYIIIDGNSNDNTLKLIKKYEKNIDLIISEPDHGIYDAMNKAVSFSSGEWIIFINSNDWFLGDNILSDVFSQTHSDADFLYGDHQFYNGENTSFIPVRPLEDMWKRISFSHQALFSRTNIMKKYKFDLSKKIAADYDFYYNCYIKGYRFKYVERCISVVSDGGLSSVSFFRRTRERWMVVREYTPSLKVDIFYLLFFLWSPIRASIIKWLARIIKTTSLRE
jgi:glycosyltransferase involved in cell wall biosynthesis